MAEVDHCAGIQADPLLRAHLGDAVFALVQQTAPGPEPGGGGTVEHGPAVAIGSAEEQARFLEAFSDRGNKEIETAARKAELRAGLDVVESDTGAVRFAIPGVDDAAGKDPGATRVVAAVGTARKQHFEPARAIAHDDDRCRGPWRALGHGALGRCREGRSVVRRIAHGRQKKWRTWNGECGTPTLGGRPGVGAV